MTKTSCCTNKHPNHSEELVRLNRIAGQVDGIKKMVEDKRYCLDIITQLRAVQSACKAIEINMLQRHLEGCVKEAFENGQSDEKIAELIKLFKKLD